MNELQVFQFNQNQLRTVTKDGDPWFVAKDVCDVLGIKNITDAIKRLEDDERSRFNLGRQGDANIINESGLYSFILRSDKPEAKTFRKWVTSEVLPSIRKHGAYMTADVLAKSIKDPAYVIGLLQSLNDQQAQINIQTQMIGELKPKADYLDLILKGRALMTITQIAKDYGMTGEKMNQLLKQYRVQFLQNGQWLLFSDHAPKGYVSSKFIPITRSDGRIEMKMTTQWTQKGRMFIYNLLKQNGTLPLIERED